MLIAYIDESYDTDTRVGYFMSAVVVREATLRDYWEAMLVAAHPHLPEGTELHGTEIFQGDKAYAEVSVFDRIGIYRQGLRVVRDHAVAVAVAYRRPFEGEEPPERGWHQLNGEWRLAVLQALVPSIEAYARNEDEFLILVADEEHTTTTHVVEMLRRRRPAGVLNTPIIETAMFARSHNSPGV